MRNLKALAAIAAALFLGAVAATLLAGCQPTRPKIKSLGTTGTTTDAPSDDTSPKAEIKDEKPDEEKEKSAEEKEKSAEEKPAEKAAEEKAADKPAEEKTGQAKPRQEQPTSTV